MLKKSIIAILAFPLGMTAAWSNPFNLEQGEGRVIITGIYTASPKQFNANGHVVDAPNYNQANIYVQGEYGLTDRFNLIVSPSFRSVNVQGPGNDSTGLGHTEIGGRYELAKNSHWVFDLQGTVRLPGTGRDFGVAQIGNDDTQYDLRALTGYTFGDSFATLETGYRVRSGRPPNEFHIDASLGTHAGKKLLLLAAFYGTISDGRGSNRPLTDQNGSTFSYNYKYRYYDLFASAVYSITPRLGVQLGATFTIAGENALRQRGPLVGVWYKF